MLITKTLPCPQLNQPISMTIYAEQLPGVDGYKLMHVTHSSCNMYPKCPLKDSYDRCPVYLEIRDMYL